MQMQKGEKVNNRMKITPKLIRIIIVASIILMLVATFFQEHVFKYPLIVKYINKIDVLSVLLNWWIIIFLYEEYIGIENKTKRLEEKKKSIFEKKHQTLLNLEKELVESKDNKYLTVQIKRFAMLLEKFEGMGGKNDYTKKVDKIVDEFRDLLTESPINPAQLLNKVYIIQQEVISEEFEEFKLHHNE